MKTQIKLTEDAFKALQHVFYSRNRNHADDLFKQCMEEEKSHRGFGDDFNRYHPNAATIAQCAKVFAVKRVAEYLLKPESYPKGQDYLHFQRSCFTAAGIADEFKADILQAWSAFDLQTLATLDYVAFVGKAA